jgi:hypothetical protein
MLEFNSTADGADPLGPYAPAGPNWQRAIRTERVRSIAGVGIEAPDADGISARWASLLERPVQDAGQGRRRISLDAGAIDFVPSSGREEVFTTVDLEAVPGAEGVFEASGVRFRVA